ncbi:MAG: hypothetical protein KDA60_01405, partial [Planctomycetales bacterium]|nr:hypothetical protein [Planctomycetales bacterium]
MKLKLSTGEGGAKAFFAKHIEKMLMGFVALISAFLVFSGLANREGIEPSKTPQDLQQKVTRTGQQIEDFSWDEYYRAERERDTNLAKIAEEALTTVPVDSYAVSQYPRPPFTPAQQRRTDPQLLVAQDVRAVAGNGILALQGVPGAERRNFDLGGTSVRQSRVEEIDSFVKPTSGAVPYQVSFVAVTALIPYQQQMDVYRDALMTRNEFDGKRDTPKYLDFEIDRAELTAPGATPNEADWQPIGNVSLALRYEGQYAGNVDEKVVLQNVSFDDFTDDKLTRELPPVKGVGDAPVWHNLAMHPGLMELALSMEEGKAGSTVGDGDEPGPVPFGAGDFNPTSAPVVDPSRRSLSR